MVADLEDRGFAYTQPDPKAFAVFLQRSEIWEGRNSATIRIEGENFLQSGDSVELTGRGQRLEKAEVETSYRAAPLQIKADYRSLPNNGPPPSRHLNPPRQFALPPKPPRQIRAPSLPVLNFKFAWCRVLQAGKTKREKVSGPFSIRTSS